MTLALLLTAVTGAWADETPLNMKVRIKREQRLLAESAERSNSTDRL